MLNVAIAVDSVTDYGPRADRVVSAACEEVIGERRCPIASDLPPGTVAAWYAIVHPTDPRLSSLRIEFRDRTADGVLIEERALTFSLRDSQVSRLASAGSVIAALVAAREGPVATPPAPTNVAPPERNPEVGRPRWSLDLAGLLSPGFGDAPSRWGGLGRAHRDFAARPFALVSARAAVHPGNPNFSWWSLSAGGGVRLGEAAAAVNVELSAELVVEQTRVAAERGAAHDSASETGWGGRVGVTSVWAALRHASFIAVAEGAVVLPRLDVVVAGGAAQRVPAACLSLALGVRFRP